MVNSPSMMPDDNKIRGQAIRSAIEVLDEVVAPGAKDRVIARLPRDVADAYRYGAIIASGWFPLAWYREFHQSVKMECSFVPDVHRRIGFAATTKDIHGMYRFILKIATPTFAFANAGRILGTYLKDFQSKLLESTPQHSRLQVEVPGADAEFWSDLSGSAEAILKTCGGRSGTVNVRSGGKNSVAVLEATWQSAEPTRQMT